MNLFKLYIIFCDGRSLCKNFKHLTKSILLLHIMLHILLYNGGHCSHDEFYMHRVPLAYMPLFRQASLEPRPSVRSSSTDEAPVPMGQPRPGNIWTDDLMMLSLTRKS